MRLLGAGKSLGEIANIFDLAYKSIAASRNYQLLAGVACKACCRT
jgi:DNA-binding CsgD family transcriptional regulator